MYDFTLNKEESLKLLDKSSKFYMDFINPENYVVLITHSSCNDGTAVYCLVRDTGIEFNYTFLQYNVYDFEKVKDVCKNKVVLISDFSFKYDEMMELKNLSKNLFLIDHHKTAIEEGLDKLDFCYINNEYCGAVLTANFLTLNENREYRENAINSLFLYLINSRDLWLNMDTDSRVKAFSNMFNACNLEEAYELSSINETELKLRIEPMDLYFKQKDEKLKRKAEEVISFEILNHKFVGMNLTSDVSDVLNHAVNKTNNPAVGYFIKDKSIVFSLRSLDHLMDVSVVARELGGGGHRNASGFEVAIDKVDLNALFIDKKLVLR